MLRHTSLQRTSSVRLALAMAVVLFAGSPDADAAAADGYWSAGVGKTSASVGYVVPSYSTTEYVAFWMKCANSAVTAFVDFPIDSIKDGNTYDVEMIVNGRSHRFPAQAAFSEMHQYALLEAPLERYAPVITDLAAAKTIRVNVQGQGFDLSTKNLREGMNQFLAACARV